MQSPLPDSSALEAGIIEDTRPSRLSRVQDNVRNLLRSSMIGSVQSTPRISSAEPSPLRPTRFSRAWPLPQPEALPSPTDSVSSTTSTNSVDSTTSTTSQHSTDMLLPPVSYQQSVRDMPHQSALSNTLALAAPNFPETAEDTTTATRSDLRSTRRVYKRSRRELRHSIVGSQVLLCVIIGLALAGMLATYIALATTTTQAPPVFHILFILGILLIAIAFIHSVARLLLVPSETRHRHRKSRRRHHERRARPQLTDNHFVPTAPIAVLCNDEVPLDPQEAVPSSAVHQPPEVWDKESVKVRNPPPAYGRWRGSVSADPELLHWRPIASPTDEYITTIPSPTYEESRQDTGSDASPPSYKTKETPVRSSVEQSTHIQPEMIEGRGIGLA